MDAHTPLGSPHTRLLVSEFEPCVRFYRDVLGFDVTWGDETTGYADFDTGSMTLALFEREAMADAIDTVYEPTDAESDDVALVIEVSAVDEVFGRLSSDATVVTEPHDRPEWGVRVAHFRDPAGTLLEINEPLDEYEE
ncbi:VOC family protein [Natronobiforma cellulositropha]|uniref:VOC family protein n=1 Tax=Natronobiforma cellulositropha TaxID=1679076 RepID=UPI0021D5A9F2|nr:VOC family protein [Natronobiforma cellulositropha]